MLDAEREERVLLAHDLGRDLEDGLGALIERAHQPGRGLQAIGEIGLVAGVARGAGDFGIVALIDQHLRQRVGIELDDPAAIRSGRTNTSGTIGCTRVEPKARPGFGLSRRISAIMSARSSSPTPQISRKRRKVAPGKQIEMSDQRLHRRIEAVALPELDRQAFVEIARAYAGRIEALQDGEHRFDFRQRRAELLRHGRKIAGEIAGLVDQIDEVLADHAPHRIADREHELLGEMIGERDLGGDEGFEIVVASSRPPGPAPAHSE